MHILLVTDSYPPEIRSASHLMLELAEEMIERGHKVTVVTSWPQYNLADGQSPDDYQEFMTEGDVDVIRVKTLPHHNVNFIVRGLAQLLMPRQFLKKVRTFVTDPVDAVIVYSPPLPLAQVGAAIKKKVGARYILNVQDLFPQNAIDLGIMTNPLLVSFFKRMERQAYRQADVVTAHSDGNRALLQREHKDIADKFITLHNWVDTDHHADDGKPAVDFRARYGLTDEVVAVFAGVMGPSQKLDVVLDTAKTLGKDGGITFLLVGDGAEKARLQARCDAEAIPNVMFQPFVSREEYPDLLAACDIGLVCLSAKNKTPVVPGKILGYMAGGLPILAFLNQESDGHAIIQDAACGRSARSDDDEAVLAATTAMQKDRQALKDMGASGKAYVTREFSKKHCVGEIEAQLR